MDNKSKLGESHQQLGKSYGGFALVSLQDLPWGVPSTKSKTGAKKPGVFKRLVGWVKSLTTKRL